MISKTCLSFIYEIVQKSFKAWLSYNWYHVCWTFSKPLQSVLNNLYQGYTKKGQPNIKCDFGENNKEI